MGHVFVIGRRKGGSSDITQYLGLLLNEAKNNSFVSDEMLHEMIDLLKKIDSGIEKYFDQVSTKVKAIRMLHIKVAEAKGLVSNELMHLPSSYTIISVNSKERGRTHPCPRTNTPDWLEQFFFQIGSSSRELSFKLFNSHHEQHDEFLGETSVDIREIKDGLIYEDWLPLYQKGKSSIIKTPLDIDLGFKISESNPNQGKVKIGIVSFEHGKNRKVVATFIDEAREKKEKFKTAYSKTNWDSYFEYSFPLANFDDIWIKLVVYKKGKSNVIGEAMFPFCKYFRLETENIPPPKNINVFLKPIPPKGRKFGQIRVEMQYTERTIRPIREYENLYDLLSQPERELPSLIYELCSNVSEKKEIFSHVVSVFECNDYAVQFISETALDEISKTQDETTLFRANSWASITLDAYCKIVGEDLLRSVLTNYLSDLYVDSKSSSCEINEDRITSGNVEKNKAFLIEYLDKLIDLIIQHEPFVPNNLRAIFSAITKSAVKKWPEDEGVQYLASSGFIFLRFFCAAILNPNLFRIMEVTQTKETPKNLLVISRVLMTLANLAPFKDPHYAILNDWVEAKVPVIKKYLTKVSTLPKHTHENKENSRRIDYADNMAIIQSFLSSKIEKIKMKQFDFIIIPDLLEILTTYEDHDPEVKEPRNTLTLSRTKKSRANLKLSNSIRRKS